MKKFKFFFNLDKEEKWLNEQSNEGWELYDKKADYKFREKAHSSTIKIDYRTFKSKKDFQDYKTLFKDSGWEHIPGSKTSGKQYFKKIEKSASADIFSDNFSKAERYQRMARVWASLAMSYLVILISLYLTKIVDFQTLLNPKSLYLTPGLWDLSGSSFWKAFLFETPFAIGRGFSWLIIPTLVLLYIIFAVKAHYHYKNALLND
ncbi:DUF2812 domain-containing protein [Carnobacterium iners]|nr:DUF2812 domain-containing protein [Carnobacterium iners]